MEDEEEYNSDDASGDVGEGPGTAREHQPPRQRKATSIKPKPQTQTQNQTQSQFQSSPSSSPTQPAHQRRTSASSSTSSSRQIGKQRQQRSSFDEDEGCNEEERSSAGGGMLEFSEASGPVYDHEGKLRNQLRPPPSASTSGLPAYHTFTYSTTQAQGGFDPSNPTLPHTHAHIDDSGQMSYTIQPQMHTTYAHSNMRSSTMGVNMFSPQGSSQIVGYWRHVGGGRRDSDGGSSTSGRSVGSATKAQGVGSPFVFEHGIGGVHRPQD